MNLEIPNHVCRNLHLIMASFYMKVESAASWSMLMELRLGLSKSYANAINIIQREAHDAYERGIEGAQREERER
jgi:hypothetical protein